VVSKFVILGMIVGLGLIMYSITMAGENTVDYSEVIVVPAQGSGSPGCEAVTNGCFIPGTATVDLGGVVIFSNTDSAAHTFSAGTADDGPTGEFDTSMVMAGQSYEWTADTLGEINYFCMVHPWMVGQVMVR
jgi:plastocyanin